MLLAQVKPKSLDIERTSMTELPEKAHQLNAALADLSRRLSAHGLVVSRMQAEWGSFGCWILEIERAVEAQAYTDALLRKEYDTPGPAVLRASWDGRDKILFLQVGRTPPLSSPSGWTGLDTCDCRDNFAAMDDALPRILRWAGN